RLRGMHVVLARLELRLGLADVLDARPGAQQRQLRVRLIAIRRRAPEREVSVGRVEPRDDVARFYAIAFGGLQLENPAADLRRPTDLRRLDVAGGAVGGRGAGGIARSGERRQRHTQHKDPACHIFPSSCARVTRWMCATTASRETPVTSARVTRAIFSRIRDVARNTISGAMMPACTMNGGCG